MIGQRASEERLRWSQCGPTAARLLRMLKIPRAQIAKVMGVSERTLHSRLAGQSEMKVWELSLLAEQIGVPPEVLWQGFNAALRWVLDHPGSDAYARLDRCESSSAP
jgi:lambda repressor-like predicted transcriptional regulator